MKRDELNVKDTELAVKNRIEKKNEQINFNDDVSFVMNDLLNDIEKLKARGFKVDYDKTEESLYHEVVIRIYK